VIWVHGGGWEGGDKAEFMEHKVPLFNGAGYVFASINYRLSDATKPDHLIWPVHDDDAADAVAWIVHHAADFGGDVHRIAIFGHSAGGGIVAAITTDGRYLGHSDLPLSTVRCAGSMDGEGYDVVAGATTSPPEWQPTYLNAFGTDPAAWEQASPIRHVGANKGIPRYFIAARGIDWRLQQHLEFVDALQKAGVPTTVLDSRELEHADLTTAVGDPSDTVVTPALMTFLHDCFTSG
jgi:acetyl esterase/lipase